MGFETFVRLILTDKEGKVEKDTGKMPSSSYVIQFLELIYPLLSRIGSYDATDVTGAESKITKDAAIDYQYIGRVDAAVLVDAYGIVVGTNAGSTPEANENYNLDTKILHSAVGAAGCLNYRAVTFVVPVVDGANVDFDISRPFINETGSTITVKETGIICAQLSDTKYHLLLRDVVADFDVDDTKTLTVVYTLRTTV